MGLDELHCDHHWLTPLRADGLACIIYCTNYLYVSGTTHLRYEDSQRQAADGLDADRRIRVEESRSELSRASGESNTFKSR